MYINETMVVMLHTDLLLELYSVMDAINQLINCVLVFLRFLKVTTSVKDAGMKILIRIKYVMFYT